MKHVLPHVELPLFTILITPLLLVSFGLIVWWVYRRDREDLYREVGEIPLSDD